MLAGDDNAGVIVQGPNPQVTVPQERGGTVTLAPHAQGLTEPDFVEVAPRRRLRGLPT